MILTLDSSRLDQRIVVQSFAVQQDGSRNLNRIIGCESANGVRRRIGERGEPVVKLRPRRALDIFEKLAHDIVEQLDLSFGEISRSDDKEVGDTPQYFGAPRDILAGQYLFEIVKWAALRVHPRRSVRRCEIVRFSSCGDAVISVRNAIS